jgi:hypothetical protein
MKKMLMAMEAVVVSVARNNKQQQACAIVRQCAFFLDALYDPTTRRAFS